MALTHARRRLLPALSTIPAQARHNRWVLAAIAGFCGTVLGGAVGLNLVRDTPIGNLTRDPNAVAGAGFYVGYVSQIGVLLWGATAAVCLFGYSLLAPDRHTGRWFLLDSAAFTLVLLLDDLFQLHEHVLPRLGVPELLVYAAYGGAAAYYLARHAATILRSDYLLLGVALGCFGFSVTLDALPELHGGLSYLAEDGAKLAGIACWLAFYVRATAALVAGRRRQTPRQPAYRVSFSSATASLSPDVVGD